MVNRSSEAEGPPRCSEEALQKGHRLPLVAVGQRTLHFASLEPRSAKRLDCICVFLGGGGVRGGLKQKTLLKQIKSRKDWN